MKDTMSVVVNDCVSLLFGIGSLRILWITLEIRKQISQEAKQLALSLCNVYPQIPLHP